MKQFFEMLTKFVENFIKQQEKGYGITDGVSLEDFTKFYGRSK